MREMGAELDLVANNHWDTASATHTRNHPFARHFCINLDAANPAAIVEGGRLDLLLASPECTHFLRARGGKPVSDQRRASAYHVQRWVTALEALGREAAVQLRRAFRDGGRYDAAMVLYGQLHSMYERLMSETRSAGIAPVGR